MSAPAHYPVSTDDDGQFYGIDGHHSPRTLLRSIVKDIGLKPREEIVWEGDWGAWCNEVTHGYWQEVTPFDDPATWTERTRTEVEAFRKETGDPSAWPYEWDDMRLLCDPDDDGAKPATYWRAP